MAGTPRAADWADEACGSSRDKIIEVCVDAAGTVFPIDFANRKVKFWVHGRCEARWRGRTRTRIIVGSHRLYHVTPAALPADSRLGEAPT